MTYLEMIKERGFGLQTPMDVAILCLNMLEEQDREGNAALIADVRGMEMSS